ncbi:hypothetical protein DPMN_009451 [Dreissena polymorpha]|uniref:Uncharacterized protein n=1 Tax=Dreissena polymorpha TaxID=45954 RepID=A0A9D4MWZ0_DREPO|nr:hypothetical protein DPMN_009451 [Dreissena polymorpha]
MLRQLMRMKTRIRAQRPLHFWRCCPPGTGRSWNRGSVSAWSSPSEPLERFCKPLIGCCRGTRNCTRLCGNESRWKKT